MEFKIEKTNNRVVRKLLAHLFLFYILVIIIVILRLFSDYFSFKYLYIK